MTDSIDAQLNRRWAQFADDVRSLLASCACPLGEAAPPRESGIYVLYDEYAVLAYVGIANDLCDRFRKHISGDESHAIQRALAESYSDRVERRAFIRSNVRVKWLVQVDSNRLADLERLLIWLYQPIWNRR